MIDKIIALSDKKNYIMITLFEIHPQPENELSRPVWYRTFPFMEMEERESLISNGLFYYIRVASWVKDEVK